MKLKSKIHLFTTVLFTILLIIFSLAIYFSFSRLTYNSEREEARNDIERTAAEIDAATEEFPVTSLLRAYVPPDGMLRLVRPEGEIEVSVSGEGLAYLQEIEPQFTQETTIDIESIDGVPHTRATVAIIASGGGVMMLERIEPLGAAAENLRMLSLVLVIISLLTLLPLFFSARWLGEIMIRPVTSLIETMKNIRRSGKFERIQTGSPSKDELHQMAETFNSMISQIEENYRKQEQFVSNASHELKTPLTVVESYASLLKRRGLSDDPLYYESVEAIQSESSRMRELTQQLLLLAKNKEDWNIEKEKVEMNELIQSTVASFSKGFSREVAFIPYEEKIFLDTDVKKYKQVLYIVLDNARKYSDRPIKVSLNEADEVVVEVRDEGIGMTEEEQRRAFERFYQADESRTDGHGLGLSLAGELMEVLGGTIGIRSEKGKGTSVFLRFPFSQ